MTPIDVKVHLQNNMSAVDYEILKSLVKDKINYGLLVMGDIDCPNCGSHTAKFLTYQDEKFFRPSLEDLRLWKSSIRSGDWKDFSGNPSEYV